MSSVEFDRVFEFTVSNVAFGNLNNEELNKLFRDGRVASHFLEVQITKWFPKLERKEIKRGRAKSDHIDNIGNIYEMKSFTKCGCKVMPSYQYGGSRIFNFVEYDELAQKTKYIVCDIRSFPLVRVIFKQGGDMVKMFPKGLVDVKQEGLLYA
jgi:hypothetical protein